MFFIVYLGDLGIASDEEINKAISGEVNRSLATVSHSPPRLGESGLWHGHLRAMAHSF